MYNAQIVRFMEGPRKLKVKSAKGKVKMKSSKFYSVYSDGIESSYKVIGLSPTFEFFPVTLPFALSTLNLLYKVTEKKEERQLESAFAYPL
jgi:hypothetical protein